MVKKLALLVILILMSGCDGPFLVIYNGCEGTWVRVRDGDGNVLTGYLPYGFEETVDLDTYAGDHVELLAVGYKLHSDEPAGIDKWSQTVPRAGYGSPTAPQLQPWAIQNLWTSRGYGCEWR